MNIFNSCEKCVGGCFTNCAKYTCIHGSVAKSVIGMLKAIYWNRRGTYKYMDRIIREVRFSIMEIQIRGTVVIGVNIGDIPKLIAEGNWRLLFESGNVDSLVATITRLWYDDKLLGKFEKACSEIERNDIVVYTNRFMK